MRCSAGGNGPNSRLTIDSSNGGNALKDAAVIPDLAQTVERYGVNGYVVVGSFRPDWLAEFKARVPRVATSILFGSPHVDAVHLARSIGATYVHPCWERHPDPSALLTPQWIARVREASWTNAWPTRPTQALTTLPLCAPTMPAKWP